MGAWASSSPLRPKDKRAQEALRARRVLSPKRHESDPLAVSVCHDHPLSLLFSDEVPLSIMEGLYMAVALVCDAF